MQSQLPCISAADWAISVCESFFELLEPIEFTYIHQKKVGSTARHSESTKCRSVKCQLRFSEVSLNAALRSEGSKLTWRGDQLSSTVWVAFLYNRWAFIVTHGCVGGHIRCFTQVHAECLRHRFVWSPFGEFMWNLVSSNRRCQLRSEESMQWGSGFQIRQHTSLHLVSTFIFHKTINQDI